MPRWANENRFDDLVHQASARYLVPVWVIKATIAQESSFDPSKRRDEKRADGSIWDSSRGLMQLLGRTAKGLGYTGPVGDDVARRGGLYDPATSIMLGTDNLAQLARRFPGEDWPAIYAAYNAGSIRRNARGEFVNSKGQTNVHDHVELWEKKANYFRGLEGLPAYPLAPRPPAAGS